MSLVFDIGANHGKTVETFLGRYDKVIAFEPNPELIELLRNKFSGNPNVVIDERGLSDKEDTKTFMLSNADTISTLSEEWVSNSRFTPNYTWNNRIQIKTVDIETLFSEYGIPDYVKIDIEGHEHVAIKRLESFLEKTIFSFEWAEEEKDKIIDMLNHVHSLGYTRFSFSDGHDKVLFDDVIIWRDFEFVSVWFNQLIPERQNKFGMIYFKA